MRVSRLVLSLILILSCSSQLSSQQPSTSAERDANATAVLNRAVAALGGTAAYSQTNGVVARGSLNAAAGGISGSILWEWAGPEFRYERSGPNGSVVFVSGHGNPALSDGGKIRRNIYHLAMVTFPVHLPSIALATSLNSPNVSMGAPQQVAVNGVSALKISLVDQTDSLSSTICQQTWYFDSTTLVPFRVDYLTSEANDATNAPQEYTLLSDYRNVSGVLLPFHIVTFFNGRRVEDVTLTSVQVGVPTPSSDFEPSVSVSGGAL